MTTYGLVHGAWHSSWHWHLIEAALRDRGGHAVTVDLPCADPAAGASEYADLIVEALATVDDDVVLVGHSLGGLTIPLVAARRPIRRLIFLNAMLPDVGASVDEQVAADRTAGRPRMLEHGLGAGQVTDDDGASTEWRPGAAGPILYPDTRPDLAAAAEARLRRQYWRPMRERTPLRSWPAVPSTYILGAGDAVISPRWSRGVAGPRLGVTPIELPGGHSPFLARPDALADLLTTVALS
jgi:pimeloyl-ACP methyl ester carboxylesterase